jgi:hypothetical protein
MIKAQTLREALNILNPQRSLQSEEELRDFFVERPESPLEDLNIIFEDLAEPQKILFTGHRGNGKSTELAKFVIGLQERFFIVKFSTMNKLNLYDLRYVDILLSIGLELITEARKRKLPIKKEILENLLKFTKEIVEEKEIGKSEKTEAGGILDFIIGKLSLKLATEDRTRASIREKLSPRLSDLLENITFISKEIERITELRILVIVDHLDLVDIETAQHLFYAHANALLAPEISIIYTFPNAIRFDNNFIQITNYFPTLCVLPNIKVFSRDHQPYKKGQRLLQEILTKRVDETLFEPKSLNKLAIHSGGIPRELIILGQRACLATMKAGRERITLVDVDRAIESRLIEFEGPLRDQERLQILRKVRDTKDVQNDPAHRELLHNLSILEYRNHDVWYDIHPLVDYLLKKSSA